MQKLRRTLTKVAMLFVSAGLLTACAGTAPPASVSGECRVFRDSLEDVKGLTPADEQRIDGHFEAGVRAQCWRRGQFKRG